MMNCRFPSILELEGSLSFICLATSVIQKIHCSVDNFYPKSVGQTFGLRHVACSAHHHCISPFDHAILLWWVWSRQLVEHTIHCTMLCEGLRVELTTAIRLQSPELAARFAFNSQLKMFDCFCSLFLVHQGADPHEPALVIHKQ
jgi:hypothetical protein